MRLRTLPVDAGAPEDGRGVEWVASAGTLGGTLAEIIAGKHPDVKNKDDFYALRQRQRIEAEEWCEAKGLDYRATVRAGLHCQAAARAARERKNNEEKR